MRQLDEHLLTLRLIDIYRSVLPPARALAEKPALVQVS
jgi:hypothetical protein